jgi:hypothetical protein
MGKQKRLAYADQRIPEREVQYPSPHERSPHIRPGVPGESSHSEEGEENYQAALHAELSLPHNPSFAGLEPASA